LKIHDACVQTWEYMRAAAIFSATILVAALLASRSEHAGGSAATPALVALGEAAQTPVSTMDAVLDCGSTRRELHFGWLAPGDDAPPSYTRPSAVCLAVFTLPDVHDVSRAPDAVDSGRL